MTESTTITELSREKRRRRDRHELERRIRERIEAAAERLERDEFDAVGEHLKHLYADLRAHPDSHDTFAKYEFDDEGWSERFDWMSLATFRDDPDKCVRDTRRERTVGEMRFQHLNPAGRTPVERLEGSLESLTVIAEYHDIVTEDLQHRVDVLGHATKIGEHLQPPDEFGGVEPPLHGVTMEKGHTKTLTIGDTGSGKSSITNTESYDAYASQFRGGPEIKVMDLFGVDGENWLWDVNLQDEELREIRERMGLPPDVESADVPTPEMQLLAPLTNNLEEEPLPYDVESDEFAVEPFTIPVDEIPPSVISSMLDEVLNSSQQILLENLCSRLSEEVESWSLADLAKAVRESDFSDRTERQVVNALVNLDKRGFFGSRDDEHALDLREVLMDTETVTAIVTGKMESERAEMLLLVYLINRIAEVTDDHRVPDVLVVIRELWKLTPHKESESGDRMASSLQDTFAGELASLQREGRKSGVHLACDTQGMDDLKRRVRKMYNRHVITEGNRDQVYEDVFRKDGRSGLTDAFYNALNDESGHAGIYGATDSRFDFLAPVHYAPPPWHLFDDSEDPDDGTELRCKYVESEEPRRPVDVDGVDWGATDGGSEPEDGYDPEKSTEHAFVDECLTADNSAHVQKSTVYELYNAYLEEIGMEPVDFDDQGELTSFATSFKTAVRECLGHHEYDMTDDVGQRDGERAYLRIGLTERGEELLRKVS